MDWNPPCWPVDTPTINIIDIKAILTRMFAGGIYGQLGGCFYQVIPIPGFGRVIAGGFNPRFFKEIRVVIDVRRYPTRADAISFSRVSTPLRFLRLDEVIILANDRIGFERLANIEQEAITGKSGVYIALDKTGVRRRTCSNQRQDFVVVGSSIGDVDPGHFYVGVLLLKHFHGGAYTLIFFCPAPSRERDSDLFSGRGSRGGFLNLLGLSWFCLLGCRLF